MAKKREVVRIRGHRRIRAERSGLGDLSSHRRNYEGAARGETPRVA